jgi:hypothetical protein
MPEAVMDHFIEAEKEAYQQAKRAFENGKVREIQCST